MHVLEASPQTNFNRGGPWYGSWIQESGGEIKWKKGPLSPMCVCVCVCWHLNHVQLCATLWTVACWSPPSMGFSRQGNWSGSPCPPPGDLFHPGTEPESLKPLGLTGRFFTATTAFALYICTVGLLCCVCLWYKHALYSELKWGNRKNKLELWAVVGKLLLLCPTDGNISWHLLSRGKFGNICDQKL